jgi:hypothetical protein
MIGIYTFGHDDKEMIYISFQQQIYTYKKGKYFFSIQGIDIHTYIQKKRGNCSFGKLRVCVCATMINQAKKKTFSHMKFTKRKRRSNATYMFVLFVCWCMSRLSLCACVLFFFFFEIYFFSSIVSYKKKQKKNRS